MLMSEYVLLAKKFKRKINSVNEYECDAIVSDIIDVIASKEEYSNGNDDREIINIPLIKIDVVINLKKYENSSKDENYNRIRKILNNNDLSMSEGLALLHTFDSTIFYIDAVKRLVGEV